MDEDRLDDLARALPKAELHLHIEGSLEPELAFALAARNGITLRWPSVEALRAAYRFADLQSFLDVYYECAGVLRTRRDFRDLVAAYLARVAQDNARHVEIFFDPQTEMANGVPVADVVEGLIEGLEEGERRHAVTWRLIPCVLRHLEEREAERMLDAILPWKHRFAALGLDSGERGNPPAKFARVFARARAAGLRAVAHAGEEGPPAYIAEALDTLGAVRIDHGVRCLEDEAVTARLAREGVPLTVCPLSNVRLCVFADMAAHPLKTLLERGLVATVNSDDPAYFGGYLNDNWLAARRALGLGAGELLRLARNAFAASFLDEADKARHLAAVDAVAAEHGFGAGTPGR